jgi:hypothetical protein
MKTGIDDAADGFEWVQHQGVGPPVEPELVELTREAAQAVVDDLLAGFGRARPTPDSNPGE